LEKDSFGSKRQLMIGACLLGAALLQVSLARFVGNGLRYIDWLLLVVVYLSLQQRKHTVALTTATIAGLLKDMSSGSGLLGVSGIAYLFAAFVADRIASVIVLDNLGIRFGTVVAASLTNTIIQLIGYQILHFPLAPLTGQESLIAMLVLSLLGNLFAAVLVFYVMDRLFKSASGVGFRRNQAMRNLRRRKYLNK
jgi:rod shape-determining protein MreD